MKWKERDERKKKGMTNYRILSKSDFRSDVLVAWVYIKQLMPDIWIKEEMLSSWGVRYYRCIKVVVDFRPNRLSNKISNLTNLLCLRYALFFTCYEIFNGNLFYTGYGSNMKVNRTIMGKHRPLNITIFCKGC